MTAKDDTHHAPVARLVRSYLRVQQGDLISFVTHEDALALKLMASVEPHAVYHQGQVWSRDEVEDFVKMFPKGHS